MALEQKILEIFYFSKINILNYYLEQKVEISCTVLGGKFKFPAQDSDLEYLFWQSKNSPASSDLKTPLIWNTSIKTNKKIVKSNSVQELLARLASASRSEVSQWKSKKKRCTLDNFQGLNFWLHIQTKVQLWPLIQNGHRTYPKGGFKSEDTGEFLLLQNKYFKLLSWAENLNKLFTVLGGKFKFSAQDSVSEYLFQSLLIKSHL